MRSTIKPEYHLQERHWVHWSHVSAIYLTTNGSQSHSCLLRPSFYCHMFITKNAFRDRSRCLTALDKAVTLPTLFLFSHAKSSHVSFRISEKQLSPSICPAFDCFWWFYVLYSTVAQLSPVFGGFNPPSWWPPRKTRNPDSTGHTSSALKTWEVSPGVPARAVMCSSALEALENPWKSHSKPPNGTSK